MADEIDIANELVELRLEASLKIRKAVGPPAKGECYNCLAPLPEGQRWCDADCRDDWYKLGNPK